MIKLRWAPPKYPTRTIIEDLMIRSGPATEDSWSPFDGQAEEFARQFSGYSRDIFNKREFLSLNRNKDFDPMQRRPPRQTLEEFVDSADAANYFASYCAGYKTHPSGQYIQTKGIRLQAIYEDFDTGESAPISHFEENFEEAPELDNRQLFDRLTYLVKNIWYASLSYKASLFSFAFAYMDILNSGVSPISRRAFKKYADQGKLLRIKDNALVPFVHEADQKYVIYTNAMDLFIHRTNPTAYNTCMEFLSILNDLGFDYSRENPYEYNESFCFSIPCLYVDTDSEFMKGAAFVNQIMSGGVFRQDASNYQQVSVDKLTCAARVREVSDYFLTNIRTDVSNVVDWKAQLNTLLLDWGFAGNVIGPLMEKFTVRDGIISLDGGSYAAITAKNGACGELCGLTEYDMYLLSTGDLLAIFIDVTTMKIKAYYSITREGRLGYAGVNWQSFEIS